MKKMHVYTVYIEDNSGEVRKETIISDSKRTIKTHIMGEVVAVKDCPCQDIDLPTLAETLHRNQWGDAEINIILGALTALGLDRPIE